jgi:hypothetical protein
MRSVVLSEPIDTSGFSKVRISLDTYGGTNRTFVMHVRTGDIDPLVTYGLEIGRIELNPQFGPREATEVFDVPGRTLRLYWDNDGSPDVHLRLFVHGRR